VKFRIAIHVDGDHCFTVKDKHITQRFNVEFNVVLLTGRRWRAALSISATFGSRHGFRSI